MGLEGQGGGKKEGNKGERGLGLMELLQAERDSGRDQYSDSVTQRISCADDFLSGSRPTWRH